MPEFFLDEAVRETMRPAGGGVFNLLGAVSGGQAFANAKRFDGSPVQTGDTTCVTAVQLVNGAKIRAVAKATLTLGGTNTLTLDGVPHPAGFMFFSTSGASLPSFNTLTTGEVFVAGAAALFAIFNFDGVLLQSANFRKTILTENLTAFLAQQVIADNEAVLHIGRSGASYSGLGGLFLQNNAATGTADSVDKFINPNASGGRSERPPIKAQPTLREITIGAGGVASINAYAPWFNPADPLADYFVTAWDNANFDVTLSGWWKGHATDPKPRLIQEHADPPELKFDLTSGDVRIVNTTGATKTISAVVERVG